MSLLDVYIKEVASAMEFSQHHLNQVAPQHLAIDVTAEVKARKEAK